MVKVIFILGDGSEEEVEAEEGTTVLDLAQAHDLELEGACGGCLACATCHVDIEDKEFYKKFPAPTEVEEDLLDFAFNVKPTSRLACQLVITKEHEGIRIIIPSPSSE